MWRDRWLATGLFGSILAVLACGTPVAALLLGGLGLAAFTEYLDVAAVPLFAAFLALAIYRLWVAWRKAP